MQGRVIKISGKNMTFNDSFGRMVTLPVDRDHQALLDTAIENLGAEVEVLTIEGKIIDLKIIKQ